MEAFGTDHKKQIMNRLQQEGYRPKLVKTEGYRPKETPEPSTQPEAEENIVVNPLEEA
jgi:hypothetical protein